MIFTAISLTLFFAILLPERHRTAAHSALTRAGLPLPDRLPASLHSLLDKFQLDDSSRDLIYVPPPPSDPDRAPEELTSPHTFHSNGQIILHSLDSYPEGVLPHPILTLIKRAEGEWSRKVARQSRTLKEAVEEYRRRYKRNPPAGFDKWWKFAKQNKILLTDEYDQIYKDTLIFWALEPGDLRRRLEQMQVRDETFTLQIRNGKLDIIGPEHSLKRASDLGEIIKQFAGLVPDFQMTFTRHDQPAVQLEYAQKERMIELAEMGEHYGVSEFVQMSNVALTNWANGCPPESPLRRAEVHALGANPPASSAERAKVLIEAYTSSLAKTRSYIYDHQHAMDICRHPEVMRLHGYTTAVGTNPGPLMPLFTFAKTSIHQDILATPLEQYSSSYMGYDPEWERKTKNLVMWRGSSTGSENLETTEWRHSQRVRLHFASHEVKGSTKLWVSEGAGEVKEVKVGVKELNEAFLDTSLSGAPVQCDARTCRVMEQEINFKPTMGLEEAYEYKYVMDVDGNGWSGRFHRLMSMKALVLKSTLFPEWYSDRIQPWVHYVPIKIDYSDLYDVMAFFRGRPGYEHTEGHDNLAKKIGAAGKDWAEHHWRKEDMAAYMFRLALEWSRLIHQDDNGSHDFEFPPTWS